MQQQHALDKGLDRQTVNTESTGGHVNPIEKDCERIMLWKLRTKSKSGFSQSLI